MCNRLPEINKNGDAGIFPVYYSLNIYKAGIVHVPGTKLGRLTEFCVYNSLYGMYSATAVV